MLKQSVKAFSQSTDYIEGQSQRNNIIIDGIGESVSEKLSDCEEKVKKLLSEKLQIDHHRIELQRAHRTGKSSSSLPSTRPRPIVAKFLLTNWRSSAKPKL